VGLLENVADIENHIGKKFLAFASGFPLMAIPVINLLGIWNVSPYIPGGNGTLVASFFIGVISATVGYSLVEEIVKSERELEEQINKRRGQNDFSLFSSIHFADRFAYTELGNWKYYETEEWMRLNQLNEKVKSLDAKSSEQDVIDQIHEILFHEKLGIQRFVEKYEAQVLKANRNRGSEQTVAFETNSQITGKELEARYLDKIARIASTLSQKLEEIELRAQLALNTVTDCVTAIATIGPASPPSSQSH